VAKKSSSRPNARTKRKAAARPAGKKAPAKRKSLGGKGASAKATATKAPKATTVLSRAELEEYRRKLLNKRREIIGDMNGIEAEALGADRQEAAGDISDHPADAGTDNFEQEFSLGLLESERQILGEINDALQRIDDRTYGICLGTGKPIGKARLDARPWSKYCIEYARLIEKGLAQPAEDSEGEADGDSDEADE